MQELNTDRPTVVFYDRSIMHTQETMAWFLREAGYRPRLLFTHAPEGSEHPHCVKRLQASGIEVAPVSSTPEACDLFVVQLHNALGPPPALKEWMRQARRVVVMTGGQHPTWRRAALSTAQHAAILQRAGRILSFGPDRTWYRFFARRVPARRAFHSMMILTRSGREALQGLLDRPVEHARRYRFSFAGNGHSPPDRARILGKIRKALGNELPWVHEHQPDAQGDSSILWVSGPEHPRLEHPDYLDSLHESVFCLSPPGWMVWTHRTVEALAAGAIPILPEPEVYHLGLEDGVHCLAVRRGDWEEAIARARSLPEDHLCWMRRQIDQLRLERLTLDAMRDHYLSILDQPDLRPRSREWPSRPLAPPAKGVRPSRRRISAPAS